MTLRFDRFGCAVLALATVFAPHATGQDLMERAAQPAAGVPAPATQMPAGQPVAPQTTPQQQGTAAGPPAQAAAAPAQPEPALNQVSLFAVTPPAPKTFAKHSLVEIIINETSVQQFKQSLETDKSYDLDAQLEQFPSLRHLLEAQFTNGDSNHLPFGVKLGADNKFEGEGDFSRQDKFTARISAEVIEVKPNGNLVLEARKHKQTDKETSVIVLGGVCRAEDVTRNNTIQSTQLANLTLRVENEGDVKDAAKKGLIPRIFDTVFNF